MLAAVNVTLVQAGLLLKAGTAVDATLIPAPSSTKNNDCTRDAEMTSSKKGNNYHFGMKAHIVVDIESGLVHTVHTTTSSSHDVTQAHELLLGQEKMVFADSSYRGVTKREEIQTHENQLEWHVAMMPSKRKALDKGTELGALYEKLEKIEAGFRVKVEHSFQVINSPTCRMIGESTQHWAHLTNLMTDAKAILFSSLRTRNPLA
jgi:transposase, IS5 family